MAAGAAAVMTKMQGTARWRVRKFVQLRSIAEKMARAQLGLGIFPSCNRARQAWNLGYTISWEESQPIVYLPGRGAAALLDLGKIPRPNSVWARFSASYAIRPGNFSEL